MIFKLSQYHSTFRYQCVKEILSSCGCLRPKEARVKRSDEVKITFSLVYRTVFFIRRVQNWIQCILFYSSLCEIEVCAWSVKKYCMKLVNTDTTPLLYQFQHCHFSLVPLCSTRLFQLSAEKECAALVVSCNFLASSIVGKAEWNTVERENRDSVGEQ